LIERFGGWPSFHDAEVLSLRIDRYHDRPFGDRPPSLTLEVQLATAPGVGADNEVPPTVTLVFSGVGDLDLEGFNHQNVLWGIEVGSAPGTEGETSRFEVDRSTSLGW
jgi:immunity protein 50 of polymorphic toxin system